MDNKKLVEIVRKNYARAVTRQSGCGCGSGCCGDVAGESATSLITGGLYSAVEVAGLPAELVKLSFGCGNPIALSNIYAGETVLDLGSGAGLDVLLSARRVGPYGKVYGLDMTAEMLAEAEANKARAGVTNVEFLTGTIENIPLSDNSVDVVVSNCVINLSVDKDQVCREMFRVLRAGGRIAVADIVLTRSLPEAVRSSLLAWAGCVAGALSEAEYRSKLAAAGFENIELEVTRVYDLSGSSGKNLLPEATPEILAQIKGSLISAFVRAKKAVRLKSPGLDFELRSAAAMDFPLIQALLSTAGLPAVGVEPGAGRFLVAADAAIVGAVGYERYGAAALLRSLVVNAAQRKSGIAAALVNSLLQELRQAGASEVYLLTETAAGYFSRWGFETIRREQIPAEILAGSALGQVCPVSSQCMRLVLK